MREAHQRRKAPEHTKLETMRLKAERQIPARFEDGAIGVIAATGDAIMNSGQNIDYTITCNGLNLFDDDLTTESAAHNYAAVDPELIVIPSKVALNDARIPKAVQVGGIVSESGMGIIHLPLLSCMTEALARYTFCHLYS